MIIFIKNKLDYRKIKADEIIKLRSLFLKILLFLEDKYYPTHLIAVYRKKNSAAYFKKQFQVENRYFVGCFDGDRLVGFIFGKFEEFDIYVDWAGVDENYRKRGIATKLFKIIEIMARNKNLKVYFNTCIKNIPAARLYLHLGYQIEGIIRTSEGVKFLRFGKIFKNKKITVNFAKMPEFKIEIKY